VPYARHDDVAICYEVSGAEHEPTVILLHGLGRQLIEWDPPLIRRMVADGFRVVATDHRDVGASTHLQGKVPLTAIRDAVRRGERPAVFYSLDDMADDVVAVIDHLGTSAAHVVGISMGGAIAQLVAIRHPQRAASLTSLMSSTGDPAVGQATPAASRALFTALPADPAAATETLVQIRRVGATPGAFDEAQVRRVAAAAIARSHDPAGVGRQLAAVLTAEDRTPRLRHLTVPTLVIHGTADPVVDASGGAATVAAVPGSTLLLIAGMGHDLPPAHWETMLQAMTRHWAAADRTGETLRRRGS
jgi:pimeloyl-ACP methyl ester carboxylesterase